MRQNATTEPVEADHLIAAELIEKLRTASATATKPIGRGRAAAVFTATLLPVGQVKPGVGRCRITDNVDFAAIESAHQHEPDVGCGSAERSIALVVYWQHSVRAVIGPDQPLSAHVGAVHVQAGRGRRYVGPRQNPGKTHLEIFADPGTR